MADPLFGARTRTQDTGLGRTNPSAAFGAPLTQQPALSSANLLQPMPTSATAGASGAMGRTAARSPSMGTSSPVSAADYNARMNPTPPALQSPGNNLVNPGYTEQAIEHTQERLLNDPSAGQMQDLYKDSQTPTAGENYLNQNLGTLDGPGQGDQYWNQVQGQFNDPFSGEQFAREATQNMAANGPASAFYNSAMNNAGQYTNYGGGNQAQGQYNANASSGPLAGQEFYNQVQGDYGTTGTYSDPNLAAGQYAQTQGAFGGMPIAQFDPFYDRARQLGVQSYNQQAAGRGVYGSSEALSGVGNVITDIEAQRANRSFDAEMQRAQEQRARQELLGNQARQGDLSSLAGFGANLAGVETFGNLANMAGNQTLGQQDMLGNQARQADMTGLDTFDAERRGLETLGNIAGQADSAETNRYSATTNAMNNADRTGIDRLNSGADIAFRGDENARADYVAGAGVASDAARLDLDRTRVGADIASTASGNDLNRLRTFLEGSNMAEDDRQGRQNAVLDNMSSYSAQIQNVLASGYAAASSGEYQSFEDYYQAELAPVLQDAAYDDKEKESIVRDAKAIYDAAKQQ